MPRPVKITGRTSSITNAFVNGIVPCVPPNESDIVEAVEILGLSAQDLRCAYCGDPSTEWDHLRPLISKRRPTGYVSEIGNLVPACGKCNQSKSGAPWKQWMLGTARRSPATRGVASLQEKVERLERFEAWRPATAFDFESVAGSELWDRHWGNWERLYALMHECEVTAQEIRLRIAAHLKPNTR